VGCYAAAELFLTATGILQQGVSSATFPALSASFVHDRARFRRLFFFSTAALAVVGILLAAGLSLFGTPIVLMLFPGRDFSALGALLPIMSWSVPFLLIAHHCVFVFAAADKQRRFVGLMLWWFFAVASAELLLIPLIGIRGAAWGLLIGRAVGGLILALSLARRPLWRD
jgi:O-antigen/teichoic acid export membrane protein